MTHDSFLGGIVNRLMPIGDKTGASNAWHKIPTHSQEYPAGIGNGDIL
jgi:hypothetical protein